MAGSKSATRMPMMAITTSSSTNVKARFAVDLFVQLLNIAISARRQLCYVFSHRERLRPTPYRTVSWCLPMAPFRDMLPRLHRMQQRIQKLSAEKDLI
jgi:hypothetical protein